MYGCHKLSGKGSYKSNDSLITGFPFLFSITCNFADYSYCSFNMEKEKDGCARVIAFKELGILNSYTTESSYYGSDCKIKSGLTKSQQNLHMSPQEFITVGADFMKTIAKAKTS